MAFPDGRALPPTAAGTTLTLIRIGDLVDDKYEVVRLLGEGGFGQVYEALHRRMGRRVVLKFLWPHVARHPEIVARFQNEARAAGSLRHENIVSVYDLEQTEDGANYIVMEHCEGRTCEEHLSDAQRFPLARAVDIISQVCNGLAAAHSKNIVHRDLKPANLLLTARPDGSELVKILDFGVAKLTDDSFTNPRTQTGLPIGTPLYMSPEQTRGERDVDQRTDIYAVGVLLFEMLSGSAPFAESPSTYDVLEQIRHSLPPSLDALVPDLPRGVSDVATRAMAKQRSERFATAPELAAALRACIEPGHDLRGVRASSAPPTTSVEPEVAAGASLSPASLETLQAQTPAAATRAPTRRWGRSAALLTAGGVLFSLITVRVRFGPNTPHEASSAIDQLSKACEGGKMSGCTQLAMAYVQGIGGLTQDPTRAAQLYTRACEGGDMQGCTVLGTGYLNGFGGLTKDPKHAVELFSRACEGGDLPGCTQLGVAHLNAFGGVTKDDALAVQLFTKTCGGGDMPGCHDLGVAYAQGLGGLTKDEPRAVQLYTQACDGGHMPACQSLAGAYFGGVGVAKDEARAAQLMTRACEGGDATACRQLAGMHQVGVLGLSKDDARSVQLLTQACSGQDMVGCRKLGVAYQEGAGNLTKDVPRAVHLYAQACDGGDIEGCTRLGMAYTHGLGGLAKDGARAVQLFSRACDAGDVTACGLLGVAYSEGLGGLKNDPARTVQLFTRACEAGEMTSCFNLASAFRLGRHGLTEDKARGYQLYAKSCEGGVADACTNLGVGYSLGLGGLPKDEARAVQLYVQACGGGDMHGCTNLGSSYVSGLGGLKEDTSRALQLFTQACNGGDMEGCTNAALLSKQKTPSATSL